VAPNTNRRPVQSARSRRRPRGRQLRLRSPLHKFVLFIAGCVATVAILILWAALARHFAPRSNTARLTFDAIIVLGTPADSDGNPTPQMLDRVSEGVREYVRGVAPRLILTGGAAHNEFTEGEAMARIAQAQGVPASAIFVEPKAHNTIQNVCYSRAIMTAHSLHSAEIISESWHLPRAAMILSQLSPAQLQWRVHPSPGAIPSAAYLQGANTVEILKTVHYLVWSRWTESCSG
jgi:uncharacterized SAM-binding protein YcdF (DUF218 family)